MDNVLGVRDVGLGGRGFSLVLISILFTSLAVFLVFLRIGSRFFSGRKLGLDDIAIIFSVCISISMAVVNILSVNNGIGRRYNDLSLYDRRKALMYFWILQIVYKVTINSTKISILFLYLRLFPEKKFRYRVFATLAFVAGYGIASILSTVWQCIPIPRVFDKTVPGHCLNLTIFWYANAASNIFSDLVILALPMQAIKSLHLHRRQKISLILVFAVGGFVCVTSILRMVSLNPASKDADQTYGTLVSTTWTTVEANLGIICASLPMMKIYIISVFPKLFNSSTGPTRNLNCSGRDRFNDAKTISHPPRPYHHNRAKSGSKTLSCPLPMSYPSNGGYKPTRPESQVGIVGFEEYGIPMGAISKTTDVDVRYGVENDDVEGNRIVREYQTPRSFSTV